MVFLLDLLSFMVPLGHVLTGTLLSLTVHHGHNAVSTGHRHGASVKGWVSQLHLRSLLQSLRKEAMSEEIRNASRSQTPTRTLPLDAVSSLISLEVHT